MLNTLWKAHYLLATKSPTPLSIAPGARKSQQQQPAFLTGPTFLIPWLSWQDLIKEAILRRGVYLRRAKALEGKRKATTTLTPLLGQRLGNKGRLTSVGTSRSITHPSTSIVTPPHTHTHLHFAAPFSRLPFMHIQIWLCAWRAHELTRTHPDLRCYWVIHWMIYPLSVWITSSSGFRNPMLPGTAGLGIKMILDSENSGKHL